MGRKLEFSKEKALMQAMESFWAQGYSDTSMRDLAQKLNLHLGSVYNALGDKEQVFEDSLRLYLQHHIAPRLDALNNTPDARAALEKEIDAYADESKPNSGANGCFLINSLLNINSINPRISAVVAEYVERKEKALIAALERAKVQGHIAIDKDTAALSRFVFSVCSSMHVMKKLGMRDSFFDDIRTMLKTQLFG